MWIRILDKEKQKKKLFYDNIYITAVRFNSRNLKHKTQCMTVDILRTRYILNQKEIDKLNLI